MKTYHPAGLWPAKFLQNCRNLPDGMDIQPLLLYFGGLKKNIDLHRFC